MSPEARMLSEVNRMFDILMQPPPPPVFDVETCQVCNTPDESCAPAPNGKPICDFCAEKDGLQWCAKGHYTDNWGPGITICHDCSH